MYGSSSHYRKLIAKKEVDFRRKGTMMTGIVRVYQNFGLILGIPMIPFGKSYEIEIPVTKEFYTSGPFSGMPEELLEVCKEVAKK